MKILCLIPFLIVSLNQLATAAAETVDYLSPESLSMPRQQIGRAMEAPAIRIYNQRGAVAFREMSVTGLGRLLFLPILKGDYRFNLSFREESTGALIQDIQDEKGDPLYFNQSAKECNDLGSFRGDPGWSLMLISQDAVWQPNLYTRTGTFHKYEKGKLISFGAVDRTSISADADEVYEEFEITNRLDRTLVLTVIPDQYSKPRKPCFIREVGKNVICAVSDLGPAGAEGWRMEIPAKGKSVGRVGLLVLPKGTPAPPGYLVADLDKRINRGQQATREMLRWAAKQLPQFYSDNRQLEEFYKRSILTVLNCRLDRSDCVSKPYYLSGPSNDGCWAWDTSFASEMLATTDPEGFKETVRNFFRGGQCFHAVCYSPNKPFSRSSWNGKLSGYIQNPFAMMQMVSDYVRLTGDKEFLDEKIDDRTISQYLKQAAISLRKQYARPDGLLDIGGGTKKMLEIRTTGYENVIATINGLAAGYFRQLAEWCKQRSDPDAAQFQDWSDRLFAAIDSTLWNDAAGWYANVLPDGSKHLVLSYHMFDLLDEPGIPKDRKLRMIQGIRDGEFLGPYGMFSIARSDTAHWDREDCDWGGGGSYVGQPLRIAEALYRLDPDKAWDVLSRCARWVERFPYFPQTIYADELALQPHQMDWALQISGGGGVQAVVFGLCGIEPTEDGSITISPHYNKSLGASKLTGYRFRGHSYDIVLKPVNFQVFRDGQLLATKPYGNKVIQKETP